MSAGEPFSICRASAELAANENLTAIDVSLVYPSPSSCSTLVRDAAANTVIGCLSVSAAGLGRLARHHPGISQDGTNFLTKIPQLWARTGLPRYRSGNVRWKFSTLGKSNMTM